MKRSRHIPILAAAALAVAPAAAAHANPWFPLKPGTTYVYRGAEGKHHARNVVKITDRTRVVGGVRCVVIDDRVYEDGRLAERTKDYYAEDARGNVRYYGEDTAILDRRGRVTSREGTWHAGVNGAKAGLYMPAHPRKGEHHRQEFYPGHAEDEFRVHSVGPDVLETREFTRLEPGVLDSKVYVRGIGQVSERTLKGGHEALHLVSITRR
jgi:hypothetical protein